MDCIDTGRRNGWLRQATGLLNAHVIFAGSTHPPADNSSPGNLPPTNGKQGEPELVSVAGAELQEAWETTARLRRRLSEQRELSLAHRNEVARHSEAAELAGQRADALAQELADVRDRLGAELDSTVKEKNYIAELLLEKSRALDNSPDRVAFLEAALSAAETECGRLTADAAKAIEREEAHVVARTRREHQAFAQVTDARERLARAQQEIRELTTKNTAAEETIAADRLARADAVKKCVRLEQDLAAQRARIAEPDQAHGRLTGAPQTPMNALNGRDRSSAPAKATIEAFTKLDHGRSSAALPAAATDEPCLSTDLGGGKAKTREQWAELLQQLSRLISLKRQGQRQSPASLLVSTISYA